MTPSRTPSPSPWRITLLAAVSLLILCAAAVHAQLATAHPSYLLNTFLKGASGEAVSDIIFKNEGWTKLAIKPLNPSQGMDGVWVKHTPLGSISKVLFVESKAEASPLNDTLFGRQGSEAYIKGQLARYEKEILSGLPKNDPLVKPYLDLQKACSKVGYPSRIVRTGFSDGTLNIAMYPVTSPTPTEAILGQPTLQEAVNLAHPKNNFHKKIADAFAREIGNGYTKSGFTPERASAVVKELRTGQITDWAKPAAEVESLPVVKLEPIADKLRASKVVRLTTPPAEIAQYASTVSKAGVSVSKTEVVSGLMLADGRVVMAAGKVGAGAGLMTFAVDGGIATIQHLNGSLTDADYERELGYAALKGTAVGGGVAVAVVLGATPAGWVVLAVGTGAYIITDFAVACYEDKRRFSSLSVEDLKAFGIPVSDRPDFGIPPSHTIKLF